jgi:hypothetical protein
MTRDRPRLNKAGTRRSSTDRTEAQPPQDIAAPVGSGGIASKRTIWIAASVALAIIVPVGLGFLLMHAGGNGSSPSVATFVGSETCAGCHQVQAQQWQSSQHRHAMDHTTEKSVLGV